MLFTKKKKNNSLMGCGEAKKEESKYISPGLSIKKLA
jgi:hypothetical protein